jgi:hypothetical protein
MPKVIKKQKGMKKLEKFSPEKIPLEFAEGEEPSTSEHFAADQSESDSSQPSPEITDSSEEKEDENANEDQKVLIYKQSILIFYASRLSC